MGRLIKRVHEDDRGVGLVELGVAGLVSALIIGVMVLWASTVIHTETHLGSDDDAAQSLRMARENLGKDIRRAEAVYEAEDDELVVECSAAVAIRFIGPAFRGFSRFPAGTSSELESVRVPLEEFARRQIDSPVRHGADGRFVELRDSCAYVRVEVEDRWGRTAWANPLWVVS